MLAKIGKRLVTVIPTLIGVVIVTFLLTRVLPGDPAVYFAGPAATPQSIAEIRKTLGFDRPLPEQFVRYVDDLAHGDLGNSLSTGQPVVTEITSRLPASAELTLARPHPVHLDRGAARHSRRGAGRAPGSITFAASWRPPASRCRYSSPACCWSMCSISCSAGRRRRSAGSTPSPRPPPQITGFYPDRQPAHRRSRNLPRRARASSSCRR